jgi:hypothetical protein
MFVFGQKAGPAEPSFFTGVFGTSSASAVNINAPPMYSSSSDIPASPYVCSSSTATIQRRKRGEVYRKKGTSGIRQNVPATAIPATAADEPRRNHSDTGDGALLVEEEADGESEEPKRKQSATSVNCNLNADDLFQQGRYAEALQVLLPRFSGADDALHLAGQVVAAWNEVDQRRIRTFDSEKLSMTARLQASRENVQQLKEDKVRLEHLRVAEQERSWQAERTATQLRLQVAERNRELRTLRDRLDRTEFDLQQRRNRPTPCTKADVVKKMAEFECIPLRSCDQQNVAALRKKILLKWHPDKQPSTDHAALATQVMQELQNRPEWSW